MDPALSRLHAWPLWQKAKRFAVSGVHEDAATGARAEEFCQMLFKCLSRNGECTKELWMLTELRGVPLRAIAAREAAAADLVIISIHHAEKLPSEIQSWIDLWLKQKVIRSTVLLALFDPPYLGTSSSIQTFLQQVAQRGKMEFMARSEEKSQD